MTSRGGSPSNRGRGVPHGRGGPPTSGRGGPPTSGRGSSQGTGTLTPGSGTGTLTPPAKRTQDPTTSPTSSGAQDPTSAPPDKKKRLNQPTTPVVIQPAPHEQLQRLLTSTGNRQAIMDAATRVVMGCVASTTHDIGPVSQLFDALWNNTAGPMTDPERRWLLQQLILALFHLRHIGLLVEQHTGLFQTVLARLAVSGGVMDPASGREPERIELVERLIDSLFASTNLDSLMVGEPLDFIVTLLATATLTVRNRALYLHKRPNPDLITLKLSKLLGKYDSHVAMAILEVHWGTNPDDLGRELVHWIVKTVHPKQWNAPDRGLAARVINLLWTVGEYTLICDLIAGEVDCTVSAKATGGPEREGVHSGYIQPMTHVLGKYLKAITLLDTPDESKLHDPARVRGAALIIAAIGKLPKPPAIELSFTKIQTCQLVTLIETGPGTIWGFEDIRLPFILAARDKKFGQRPLRMLDLWPAVGTLVDPKSYAELVANPKGKIAKAIMDGLTEIHKDILAAAPRYDGINESAFVAEFKPLCEDFLSFFADSRVYGAFLADAKLSGKDSEKRLSAYACTVGLHWCAKRGIPVYYCLDGLNMDDVVNYKRYKLKEINVYLSSLGTPTSQLLKHTPFTEIITLAEVREILRRWTTLSTVVRFVEQGVVMSEQASDDWVKKWLPLLESSEEGKHREWLPSTTFYTEVSRMRNDPDFWALIGTGERWKCVKESNAVLLAADNSERIDLLLNVLANDCPTLRKFALVPDTFVHAFGEAHALQSTTTPPELVSKVYAALDSVADNLRPSLEKVIQWRFGPRQ